MEMTSAIFSTIKNNKGQVVETICKYLDTDTMLSQLIETLKEERDEFCESVDLHDWYMNDEFIEEYASRLVDRFNSDMKTYLHGEHKISGNFNNIDYDYNIIMYQVSCGKYGADEIDYNHEGVASMIERLDNGDTSEIAELERKALLSWFWETFGSFGITYNFGELMSEEYYEYCYCNDIEID